MCRGPQWVGGWNWGGTLEFFLSLLLHKKFLQFTHRKYRLVWWKIFSPFCLNHRAETGREFFFFFSALPSFPLADLRKRSPTKL